MTRQQWLIPILLDRAKRVYQQRQMVATNLAALRQQMMEGSQLTWPYLTLVVSSCLIASFGLLANSAAVIIGAMLVAPLMPPLCVVGLWLAQANWAMALGALLLYGTNLLQIGEAIKPEIMAIATCKGAEASQNALILLQAC